MITVFILAVALVIMLVVWALLFFQHRDDLTNRALRVFLLGALGWGLLELIFFLPIPLEAKYYLKRGQIVFWGTLNFLFIRFIYRWLGRQPDAIYAVLAVAAVVPLVLGLPGDGVVASVADGPYGLIDQRGPWHTQATMPPLATGVVGLGMVLIALIRRNTTAHPQSLWLILTGGMFSLSVGFIMNLIIPTFLGMHQVPRLGSIAALPLAVFVYWAVRRHSFLALGPEHVVDSLFANVRQGLVLAGSDGAVRRLNPAAETMFGVAEAEEFRGRLIDLPGGFALRDCPPRGGQIQLRNDGEVTHLRVVCSSEGLKGGKLLILQDVTEEKRRQELARFATERIRREIERRKRELEGIRRLEQIGTTAGVITHDFNNFMAVIMGFARAARDDLPGEHPVRRDFDGITATVHRARDLVQQVLAFSRRSSSKVVVFSLADEIHEATKLLQLASARAIDVKITPGPEAVQAEGDPVQIRQALLNLLTNAYQAMEEHGGRIEVQVGIEDVDAAFALMNPPLEPCRYGVVTVSDTGRGMDAETLGRAFEPYFSGRYGARSVGLGLSTALKIVQARRGTIIGESAVGKGSAFRLYVPLLTEADQKTAGPSKNDRIIFLAPSNGNGVALADELGSRGYCIERAASLEELYRQLERWEETVRIVVAPFEVKVASGAWAAPELARRAGDVPVALLVNRASVAKQALAREMGVRACIPLFLEHERIAERIEALIQ